MSQTILIVEDEKRIAHWVKRYFERAGFSTKIAYDGQTGLALARSLAPDLIVLDLMLPSLDGMEICHILRRESDVPIIMLTAKGSQPDRINGLESGADDYIVKPSYRSRRSAGTRQSGVASCSWQSRANRHLW